MFRRVDKLMEVERSGATSSERLTWLHPLQGRGAPKSSRLEHPLSTDSYTTGRWFDRARSDCGAPNRSGTYRMATARSAWSQC